MKRHAVGLVTVTLLLAPAAASRAAEQGVEYVWNSSVGAGMLLFEGDEEVEDSLIYALRLGVDLTESWSLDGTLYLVPTLDENFANSYGEKVSRLELATGDAAIDDTSAWGLAIDGLYHFTRWERLDPYLALGVGVLHYEDDFGSQDDPSLRVGGGVMYHMNDQLSVRVDARSLVAGDDTEANAIVTAGLMWTFGAATGQSDASSPTDWDGDGLSNEREVALGTDPNEADTDDDGINDAREVQEFRTDPTNRDSDYDYLTDGEEVSTYNTDPLERDTDGGKVCDGHEVLDDGTDPRDPGDDLMFFELAMQFGEKNQEIRAEYLSDLDAIAKILRSQPEATARVEAHAALLEGRSAWSSRRVTRRRAAAVKAYMTETWDIAADRIRTVGYGHSRPKQAPNPEGGNPANRRIEIYLRGADKARS